MILHIVNDEKFIDRTYQIFEKASPGNNKFMIVTNKIEFEHIKNTPITRIDYYQFLSKKFAQSLTNYDFIIIHAIFDDNCFQLVMNADENIKFVWIGWGADYYKFINHSLYFEKTLSLLQSDTETEKNKTSIKQKIKSHLKRKLYLPDICDKEKAINRFNYFAPVLEEEYVLVKKSFKDFKPKYIDWNYPFPQEILNEFNDNRTNGSNILIGNSASFTNNHIEAFEKIKKLNIKKRKIIVPLSYGNENYKCKIIKYGQEIFENNFNPLVEFMPLSEYNKILSTCSIVVMNHLRQQAGDNIIIMLLLGAKIFLNNQNPFCQFLIKNGVIVFSMDELNNENISIELTRDQVNINRKILQNIYSEDRNLSKTISMIDTVIKK